MSELRECTQTIVQDQSDTAQSSVSAADVNDDDIIGPFQLPPGLDGPVDYSDLCVPQSYYINGINIDTAEPHTRKELLSSRGPWPGKDVITYQDQFVANMRAMEEKLASGGTHDGVKDARDSDGSDSDRVFTGESGHESDDEDEDGVTISFIMGSEGAGHVASLDIIQRNRECIILSKDSDSDDDDDDDEEVDDNGEKLEISESGNDDNLGYDPISSPPTAVPVVLPPIPPPLTFRDIKNLERVALQKMISKERIHFPPPYLPSPSSSNIAVHAGSCFMVQPPPNPMMPAALPLPGNAVSGPNISANHQQHALNRRMITGYPINPLLPFIPPPSRLVPPPPHPQPDEMSQLFQLSREVRENAARELLNPNLLHSNHQGNVAQHWGRPPANRMDNRRPPNRAWPPHSIPPQPHSRPRPPMTIRRCYEHIHHPRNQRRGYN
ncbi:uncharacterized protein [Diadema setosum]|uniref:uncharacterized protein n=1 Tax=Diadema setosum TaxID=31175 RepID=UPI003B3A4140